jgi:hypothetical protein
MLETRDGVEDHPWGICDSLCVEEMTGRIVSDSDVQETAFHGTARAQELRNVSDSVRECLGRGVITEQPPVFFEHRTTSSAVDGNRSVRRIRESLEVVPSQRDCRLVLAGVGMECAAATLPGCFEDLVPVGPEYALCGGVHVVIADPAPSGAGDENGTGARRLRGTLFRRRGLVAASIPRANRKGDIAKGRRSLANASAGRLSVSSAMTLWTTLASKGTGRVALRR